MSNPGDTRAPAPTQGDWAVQTADSIERVVDGIRSKTTVPITTVARAIVYGIVAATVGMAALILLTIGLIRLLDVYLDDIPGNWLPTGVWVPYLLLGTIFVLAGLFFWKKRTPAAASTKRG